MRKALTAITAAALVALGAGCNNIQGLIDDAQDDAPDVVTPDTTTTTTTTTQPPVVGLPSVSQCTLTGMYKADVRSWAETSALTAAYDGTTVTLNHTKAGKWSADSGGLEGNPWVIAEVGGTWYASSSSKRIGVCRSNGTKRRTVNQSRG